MSLFLTSDEKTLKSNNSRVKFSNEISQDFFQDYPFNLSLKDVYFDPNFPMLTSDNAPHVITIIKGEHPSKKCHYLTAIFFIVQFRVYQKHTRIICSRHDFIHQSIFSHLNVLSYQICYG